MSFISKVINQLFTNKPEACASDEKCCIRSLPKISSQIVQARMEPGPFTWRAGFVPTKPQEHETTFSACLNNYN